jgi:hypothetical protein
LQLLQLDLACDSQSTPAHAVAARCYATLIRLGHTGFLQDGAQRHRGLIGGGGVLNRSLAVVSRKESPRGRASSATREAHTAADSTGDRDSAVAASPRLDSRLRLRGRDSPHSCDATAASATLVCKCETAQVLPGIQGIKVWGAPLRAEGNGVYV